MRMGESSLGILSVLHIFLASQDAESGVPENPGTARINLHTAPLSGKVKIYFYSTF